MEPDIDENLRVVRAAIAESERISGRLAGTVELVAVTKTHPVEVIRQAVEAGQILFGENRVQEAKAKIPGLPVKLRWHLIGHLQSNKIRQALPLFEIIHGVDSVELLEDIQRIAGELGLFPRVFLQVNVAGESSKFGFPPERLLAQVERIGGAYRVAIEEGATLVRVGTAIFGERIAKRQ